MAKEKEKKGLSKRIWRAIDYLADNCGVVVGILVILLIIFVFWSCIKCTSGTPSSSMVGSEYKIYNSSGGSIYVANDKESWNKLLNAISANDDAGINELVIAGRIFSVDVGTKVKVIDISGLLLQIRILDGKKAGSSAWVGSEFIK